MSDFWQSFGEFGPAPPSVRVEPGHPAVGTCLPYHPNRLAYGGSMGHYTTVGTMVPIHHDPAHPAYIGRALHAAACGESVEIGGDE